MQPQNSRNCRAKVFCKEVIDSKAVEPYITKLQNFGIAYDIYSNMCNLDTPKKILYGLLAL